MVMKKIFCFVSLLAVFAIVFLGWVNHKGHPVRIGFVADLSTDLGSSGRNGSQLAVEEINENGGIDGHPVELVVENNSGNHQSAWEAVQKLIDQDVVAIIGHMTSEMSYSTHDLIEKAGIFMLSPTNSTDMLTDMDDHFLRIYPAASMVTGKLSRYVFQRDIKNFAILYDQTNYAYSKSWSGAFQKDLQALGGKVEELIPFDGSNLQTGFLTLAKQIQDAGVDGVLVLARPMHTALICQQFNKINSKARLFATEWSYSPTLLSFGGDAVSDLSIVQTYLPEAIDPKSLDLKDRLQRGYNQEAWFAPAHAYDATRMLIAALKRNEDRRDLKKTLLSLGAFAGVQSPIHLNNSGDAERIYFIRKLSDGKVTLTAQI